jgi:drug/metabolite transporter (DMT)-like permease
MHYDIGLFLCFVSIVATAGYMVSLKNTKKRLIALFWANVFTYIGYLGIYFFKKTYLEHDTQAVEELLYNFTFTNVPLYILMALCWVGSLILLNHLMEQYDVSLVVPVTEVGILFTTIGYVVLGNQFSLIALLSVSIVFIGALVSGMKKFSITQPFKELKQFPYPLLVGGVMESIFEASAMMITFLVTQTTPITTEILEWLTNTFHHIYTVPFSFRHPFYYNVGVRFFITLIFLLYMIFSRKYTWDIITELYKDSWNILLVSALFLGATVAYHESYLMIPDKNVLAALRKLTIPTILTISHFFLKEKITPPKIIGCIIIVVGGMLSLLV